MLALLIIVAVLLVIGNGHQVVLIMITIFGVPLFMAGAAMAFIGWQRVLRGKWLLISGAHPGCVGRRP